MPQPFTATESAVSASLSDVGMHSPAPVPPAIETIIAPSKGWIALNWAELFHTRELLYFLIWRDIKVRYKQAMLGVAWVVLQPLFNMILFTVVFGAAAGFSGRLGPIWGPKYSVFVFAALLPWQLFATGLNAGGLSLLSQQNLVTKIYFPRLYVPTSVIGGALLDMAVAMVFVTLLMGWFHVMPSGAVLMLPLLLVLTIACALAVAYLFSALTINYRDFRFLIPFVSQVWMFASFVAFPPSVFGSIGPKTRMVLALNPMYGITATWRKLLMGGAPDSMTGWSPLYLVSSVVITLALLLLGMFYFRRTERRFADIA
jgi:lipopolysaccharide transport system permease protein